MFSLQLKTAQGGIWFCLTFLTNLLRPISESVGKIMGGRILGFGKGSSGTSRRFPSKALGIWEDKTLWRVEQFTHSYEHLNI